jgi:hypothetical protein
MPAKSERMAWPQSSTRLSEMTYRHGIVGAVWRTPSCLNSTRIRVEGHRGEGEGSERGRGRGTLDRDAHSSYGACANTRPRSQTHQPAMTPA